MIDRIGLKAWRERRRAQLAAAGMLPFPYPPLKAATAQTVELAATMLPCCSLWSSPSLLAAAQYRLDTGTPQVREGRGG